MAVISANGSTGKQTFTLTVTETGTSNTQNTSTLAYTFTIGQSDQGSWPFNKMGTDISFAIVINGATVGTGYIPEYDGESTVTLASGTTTVKHNVGGAKTIDCSFQVVDNYPDLPGPGNASASGTMTLTTISIASYTLTINQGVGSIIRVERTASMLQGAPDEVLSDGAVIYHGDVIGAWFSAETGYELTSQTLNNEYAAGGYSSKIVGGNCTAYARAAVLSYSLSISEGTGANIWVNRTNSPLQGAGTGFIGDGATIYYSDVLNITAEASSGYEIESCTVNGADFVSGDYVSVTEDVSIAASAAVSGLVYIHTGTAYEKYIPYVWKGPTPEGDDPEDGSVFPITWDANTQYAESVDIAIPDGPILTYVKVSGVVPSSSSELIGKQLTATLASGKTVEITFAEDHIELNPDDPTMYQCGFALFVESDTADLNGATFTKGIWSPNAETFALTGEELASWSISEPASLLPLVWDEDAEYSEAVAAALPNSFAERLVKLSDEAVDAEYWIGKIIAPKFNDTQYADLITEEYIGEISDGAYCIADMFIVVTADSVEVWDAALTKGIWAFDNWSADINGGPPTRVELSEPPQLPLVWEEDADYSEAVTAEAMGDGSAPFGRVVKLSDKRAPSEYLIGKTITVTFDTGETRSAVITRGDINTGADFYSIFVSVPILVVPGESSTQGSATISTGVWVPDNYNDTAVEAFGAKPVRVEIVDPEAEAATVATVATVAETAEESGKWVQYAPYVYKDGTWYVLS